MGFLKKKRERKHEYIHLDGLGKRDNDFYNSMLMDMERERAEYDRKRKKERKKKMCEAIITAIMALGAAAAVVQLLFDLFKK